MNHRHISAPLGTELLNGAWLRRWSPVDLSALRWAVEADIHCSHMICYADANRWRWQPPKAVEGKAWATQQAAFHWLAACCYQLCLARDRLRGQRLCAAECRGLLRWAVPATQARQWLMQAHLGMAYSFAARVRADEDRKAVLVSVLVLAVDRFDPSRGYQFSSYYFRAARNALRTRKELPTTDIDIALLAAPEIGSPEDSARLRQALRGRRGGLTRIERQVVDSRYGLSDGCPRSWERVGEAVGCGWTTARLHGSRAMTKLRSLFLPS